MILDFKWMYVCIFLPIFHCVNSQYIGALPANFFLKISNIVISNEASLLPPDTEAFLKNFVRHLT